MKFIIQRRVKLTSTSRDFFAITLQRSYRKTHLGINVVNIGAVTNRISEWWKWGRKIQQRENVHML